MTTKIDLLSKETNNDTNKESKSWKKVKKGAALENEGKVCHWCPKHNAYTIHTPEEGHLKPKSKCKCRDQTDHDASKPSSTGKDASEQRKLALSKELKAAQTNKLMRLLKKRNRNFLRIFKWPEVGCMYITYLLYWFDLYVFTSNGQTCVYPY